MKNVTISMDEGLLKAAKEYAAQQGISFQELVRRLVRQAVRPDPVQEFEQAVAYAEKLNIRSDGRYFTREEAHDREGLRRHQHFSVRDRSDAYNEEK